MLNFIEILLCFCSEHITTALRGALFCASCSAAIASGHMWTDREDRADGITTIIAGRSGNDGSDLPGLAQALDVHRGHDPFQHIRTDGLNR